jgi:hypothetical protein
MTRRTVPCAILLWVVACLIPAAAQTSPSGAPAPREIQAKPAAEPPSWESFFLQVPPAKTPASTAAPINAQPALVMRTPSQEAIGLTDQEAALLFAVAADCQAQLRKIEGRIPSLTFESRLEFIETGEISKPLAHKLQAIDTDRAQVVQDHVLQLKIAVGDATFERIEAYRKNRAPDSLYFPLKEVPRAIPDGKLP